MPPVKHRNKSRVPVDLEPSLMNTVEEEAKKLEIARTALIRIFIKYGINNLKEAVAYGDRIAWQPKDSNEEKRTGEV